MSNYKIKVKVEIVECDEAEQDDLIQAGDGGMEFIMNEDNAISIDACEKALLNVNYEAMRNAMSTHLTKISKKKTIQHTEKNERVVNNIHPYQVDGELGRFTFQTHSAYKNQEVVFASQKELFLQVGGSEWYKTIGFKEIALIYGTVEMSYKKAHILINRIRYQDENITPCRTLHDNTEKEGAAVLACVNQKSAAILKENNFTLQGVPQDETEVYGEDGAFQEEADVKEAIESLNNQADYLSNPIPYELPECTVNITVDDVLVKKQNEIRDPKEKPKEGEKKISL